MKSLSLRFKTIQRLESFIHENELFLHDNLIVQIYSPTLNLANILDTLNNKLPKATVCGVEAKSFLLNGVLIENEIVLTFLLLDNLKIESKYFKNENDIDKFFFMNNQALYLTYSSNQISKDKFINLLTSKITLIGTFYNSFIIKNTGVISSGLFCLKITGDFDIDIKIIDKIEPIGRELKIEKIEENKLLYVDSFTVKELYSHFLTSKFSHDISQSSYSFPLLVKKKNNYQSYLILKEDESGAKLTSSLKQDDIVQLGFSHASSYYKDFQTKMDSLNKKSNDIFIAFNSVGREKFFKNSGFEYKNAIGSFSKSELVIYKNKIYDLNLSSIMLLLNKKSLITLQKKQYKKQKDLSWDISIVNALSNIAKVSSSELQSLNNKLESRVAKEIEKNLKKDAVLIHNAKLAQMGEMMSMIAHQWKQPLSAISATSSGLHIKIELDMYEREFFLRSLAKIEDFVNHLSSTIDDFSNFFKPSKRSETISLSKLVEKAMTIASYSLTKHSIKVYKNIDDTIIIDTHTNELVQVILNIIKNAENILLSREIEQPQITLTTYKVDEHIYLEIEDNARGIDKNIINKIFEPYFSTKATKDSTGLGLYMSRLIVEDSLNGKLLVKNSENGAVFSIVLV